MALQTGAAWPWARPVAGHAHRAIQANPHPIIKTCSAVPQGILSDRAEEGGKSRQARGRARPDSVGQLLLVEPEHVDDGLH